ncbi:MAG: AMP-dependent synthetase [Proteobacteria bacterium]|nr:MAG: AMP-dependent synthetase [Pseudomonadota bacterium]
MSTMTDNLKDLLATGAETAAAITSPGGKPLTYGGLRRFIGQTVEKLNALGVGRNDRVAIVLDNGPEMAVSFLAIASGATSAPLNPTYRSEEFEFYLTDLKAKLLIVEARKSSPAIEVANRLGIAVAQLIPTPEAGAGMFGLEGRADSRAKEGSQGGYAAADDVALVLHTSGTTSRPKIVPLSQRNVSASAANVRGTLRLTDKDRGLNIMPLFHIHGLIAGLLAPLSAGGEVCCTPGFNALQFFRWMGEMHPTWYTAVPTMHQTILSRAAKSADVIKANPLRFIRSSSSALPTQVIRELEETFGAPLIESYGMTEAAHQMASNPLPPEVRKPGSVGKAAGPEVGIMDLSGNLLAPGETGEIVIRGPNVTRGYENNAKANGEAFTNGWFRTGDQGIIDADGYVSITGRLKEIINRGGEKISPREVDEVLMDHPAVQQVVTFAVPHDKLGEDVGAAVVLREGASATDKELREFCAERLAQFKVPRTIVFLTEIPKGATGKLQRIGLAQKLGLAGDTPGR